MRFSSFFRSTKGTPKSEKVRFTPTAPAADLLHGPIYSDKVTPPDPEIRTISDQVGAIPSKTTISAQAWCLPTQRAYLLDAHPLRIVQKGRQVGFTKTDSLDTVLKVCPAEALHDVYVTTRDEVQARLYGEDVMEWARILHLGATSLGMLVLDPRTNASAYTIEFANGRRVYCLSSNPNALAGKRGHVKLDEFALHQDQRTLYYVAKPVTTWGGTLSIISTHRGPDTVFNQIIQDILHKGNPMGWHLYTYSIHQAVEEGMVERINQKSGRNETPGQFLARIRSECLDEEQWLQEYCCQPTDQNSAFFSHEMIHSCTGPNLKLMSLDEFLDYARTPLPQSNGPGAARTFYAGIDVGRVNDLFVMDVGELLGKVMWDRVRIDLQNRSYTEMEEYLYPVLQLPQLKRCCIDKTGAGGQLTERAKDRFGYKVEGVHFSGPMKENLAFALRGDFEDRRLCIADDQKLHADLRALKKETTSAGNIRLDGNVDESHCDRTWAKALRQHAARLQNRPVLTARVG